MSADAAYEGSSSDRERLILSLAPVVERCVRRARAHQPYADRIIADMDDITSDAWVGAMAAVDDFDPSAGIPLTAYATIRINGMIGDELRRRDYLTRKQRADQDRQIPAYVDARSPVSYHADPPSSEAYRPHYLERLEDRSAAEAFDHVDERFDLTAAIAQLPEPERRLIVGCTIDGRTLRDVGQELGIGESRASQILKVARQRLAGHMTGSSQPQRRLNAARGESRPLKALPRQPKMPGEDAPPPDWAQARASIAELAARLTVVNGHELTERESQIIAGTALGMTTVEIATALFLTQNTVKTQSRHLLARVGARTRAHLVGIAAQSGLLAV